MPERKNGNRSLSPEEAEILEKHVERIRKSSNLTARRDQARAFSNIHRRMDRERAALTEKFPRKWVVMGKDGVVTLGDSLEEVVAEAHSRGLRASDMAVEFLDPDPPIYVL